MAGVRRQKKKQVPVWVWGCVVMLVTGTVLFWYNSMVSDDESTTGITRPAVPLAATTSSSVLSSAELAESSTTSASNNCPDLHCKAAVCECPQHVCPQQRCDCWDDDRTQPIASTRSVLKAASASLSHSQLVDQERAILEPDEYDDLPFGKAGVMCLRELTTDTAGSSAHLVHILTQFREALFEYHSLGFTVVAPQGLEDLIVLSMFQNVFPEDSTSANTFAPDEDEDSDNDGKPSQRKNIRHHGEKKAGETDPTPSQVATAWTAELCGGRESSGTHEADWLKDHPPVSKAIKHRGKFVVSADKFIQMVTPPQERVFFKNMYPAAPIVQWMSENMDTKIYKTERLTSVLILPTKGFKCQYDNGECCPSYNDVKKVLNKRVMAGSEEVQKITIAFDGCDADGKEKTKVYRLGSQSTMFKLSTIAPELNPMQAEYVLALVAARANILIGPKGLPFLSLVHSLRTLRWHVGDGVALDVIQEWPDIASYPVQFTYPLPVL